MNKADPNSSCELVGKTHSWLHGRKASQAPARLQSVGQADGGYGDWFGGRVGARGGHTGPDFRAVWRTEGRQGEGGKTVTQAPSRDSAQGGQGALEIGPRRLLSRAHPLLGDRLIPHATRGEQLPVTVCIAARAENVIIGVSDRMLTSGDVQFEPYSGQKIVPLTNSIFIMTAGDAGLHALIANPVMQEIGNRVRADSKNWWLVREVADLFISQYNSVRNKRAEDAILRPLYLDQSSFIANQAILNDRLANDVAKELLNFGMPIISLIVAGVDPTGAHIYAIQHGDTGALESTCLDGVGFATIGSGSRHASSQFMFASHAWNSPLADTLFLSYYAKRKAEVAPGVGKGTDLVSVGPGLATLDRINPEVVRKLEVEYRKVVRAETRGFSKARAEMKRYVDDLQARAQAARPQGPAPEANGGTAPADKQ
jgi:hypothetical protein